MALVELEPSVASAHIAPMAEAGGGHVTADALPTVQINGVVWDQEIIGNTVYAVGEFTSARPAGAASGENETPRSNMLAYDLVTGNLIESFAPMVNRQIKAVTKSPDGSRLYIGGEFTAINGVNKYRIGALDPNTGSLIPNFNPIVDYRVNDIAATGTTVYAAGAFNYGQDRIVRSRLAAFTATTGAATAWAPAADNEALAITLGPDGNSVFVGGRFQNVNGSPAYGLAKIDATTGALIPWAAATGVRDAGTNSAILSISTDGRSIFGTGYHFGNGGNLEGSFSADPDTGALNWIEDCHGDHYDHTVMNGYVYTVSHSHYCANIGGYPQSSPWTTNQRHAMSTTVNATGINRREAWGYANWEGTPSPSLVNWSPQFTPGEYTGKTQAAWTVEGNGQYLVMGGEFLRVNTTAQQGLVRFAVKPIAPAQQGPRLGGSTWPANVQSKVAGEVRISLPANWDRDDGELTYRIVRDSDNAHPIHQTRVSSTFWDQPTIGFTDSGLTPGSTHSYRVFASDDDGNDAATSPVTVTVASIGASSAYSNAVLADGARLHWRLNEPAGSSTADAAVGPEVGTASNVTFGVPGAILNEGDTAAQLTNSSTSRIVDTSVKSPSDNFSVEAWVRTSSSQGGRIIGMGNSSSGSSSTYDRLLYMTNNGRVMFGARANNPGSGPNLTSTRQTIESQSGLNNSQWHHVVGTLGPQGMHLYVDGIRVASRGDVTRGQAYETAYWRVGADTLSGWGSRPTSDHLSGQVDEPAVYEGQLTAAQVARHYTLSGRTPLLTAAPADTYGAMIRNADPYLYYRLGEPSSTTATDSGMRANTGDYVDTVTRSQPGVIAANNAAQFGGTGFVASRALQYAPTNYSVETWFSTSSITGGAIIGFGNARGGASTTADRQVYMRDDGQLVFRVSNGASVTSAASFNDGAWHHVVATQGQNGMKLYVDGTAVGTNPQVLAGAYSGYWRIGGDTTGGGSTSTGFGGRIDEPAVYERVLSQSEVVQHLTAGGGQVANIAPTASFNASTLHLDMSVDATSSSDPDGVIGSFDWDFGDGTTATGLTVDHNYATAGTYTVTLKVTDDDGAFHTTTREVTTTERPANEMPTSAFEFGTEGLEAIFDGSGSFDPDGSIASYAWDFGDGATGTGMAPAHVFGADGTYQVTMTVTDDRGGTSLVTRSVAVQTAPRLYAADTFDRTAVDAWGTADKGGAWTVTPTASRFAVNGGLGTQRMVAGNTDSSFLNDTAADDVTAAVDLSWDKVPTGGGDYASLAVRRIGTSDYRARVRAMPASTTITLSRVIDGVETNLLGTTVPGLVYNVGDTWRVQLEASGTGITNLSAKVWKVGTPEPGAPLVMTTDSTATLQAPGGVGMVSYLSGTTTNGPVLARYDNLVLSAPGWAPPVPNVAPTAAFTATANGLHVGVDGSTSLDTDGAISTYAWTFGDGGTATGPTASHDYAAAGTFPITLTVTDDDGATAAAIQNVTVVVPSQPDLVNDAFTRTTVNGFGTAELGGAWTVSGGATHFSVSGGTGRIQLPTASVSRAATLATVSAQDVEASVDLTLDKAPTGGGTYMGLAVRKVGNTEYRLRARVQPTTTTLQVLKVVNNVEATVTSQVVPSTIYTEGSVLHLLFRATGSGTTSLTATMWLGSNPQPPPQIQVTDTTAELQSPGGVGLHAYVTGSTTNAPLVMGVDNLRVRPV